MSNGIDFFFSIDWQLSARKNNPAYPFGLAPILESAVVNAENLFCFCGGVVVFRKPPKFHLSSFLPGNSNVLDFIIRFGTRILQYSWYFWFVLELWFL